MLTYSLVLAILPLAAGAQEDPLCSNEHGISRFNPMAKGALVKIRKCVVFYCDPKIADSTVKSNLKHIDARLGELLTANKEMGIARAKFIAACRALNGDLTQIGPKMDNMRTALDTFTLKTNTLAAIYHELQTDPDESIFNKTSMRMATEFKQLPCMDEINSVYIDNILIAKNILETSKIDCSAPPVK